MDSLIRNYKSNPLANIGSESWAGDEQTHVWAVGSDDAKSEQCLRARGVSKEVSLGIKSS